MITEAASQDFLISCISGVSRPQIERYMEKYYGCDKEDIKELIKIHEFKKKPRFVNYKKFYDLKIPDTAEKLKYPFTQIYRQENFLSQEECDLLIEHMNTELHPSAVSNEKDKLMFSDYRTSMTCNFSPHLTELGTDLTIKIGDYLNLDPFLGEAVQGQKYEEGEFYKAHWDYYDPLCIAEYHTYCQWMGQRTWTFMIYLNDVEEGGETYFKFLNLKVKPEPGLAIFWNNLYSFGIEPGLLSRCHK
jgi:prolyl 4-hydroxylase